MSKVSKINSQVEFGLTNPETMERTPKVSVIVPVYKVEKYLPECIESVLAQTFTDFELILVDDGSPDNSGKICDDYAARDSRIRVFHKENGGTSAARSLGLKKTRGEWISFLDGDDKLFPESLRRLFDVAFRFPDADIIEGKISVNGKSAYYRHANMPKRCTCFEYAKNISLGHWNRGPWGKIFRKSIFCDTTFSIPREIIFGEDVLMNVALAARGRFYARTEAFVYYYNQRLDSPTCLMTRPTDVKKETFYISEMEKILIRSALQWTEKQRLEISCGFRLFAVRALWHQGENFSALPWVRLLLREVKVWPTNSMGEKLFYCMLLWFPMLSVNLFKSYKFFKVLKR